MNDGCKKQTSEPDARPLALNVFSTFAVGGPQVRFAEIANQQQGEFRHLLFSVDRQYACSHRLNAQADVRIVESEYRRRDTISNTIAARKTLRRLQPDMVATFNWGAIEWAVAATLARVPHIHVVDGFGPDEAETQLARRIWFRRLALARCSRIVVPSRMLHRLVRDVWRFPESQIAYIPNGIDAGRFARATDEELVAALGLARDRPVLGTVATLRKEKNIGRLLEAVAHVLKHKPVTLVIVGDGPERAALMAQARFMGLSSTVYFTGSIAEPERILPAFDIFALSSDTEQMPISVIEAMAAGLPIASVDVGDVREMVSPDNRDFVVARSSRALGDAILRLLSNKSLRLAIGTANRTRSRESYDTNSMVQSYGDVYRHAMGRI